MSVVRVTPGPCWAVAIDGHRYEAHHPDRDSALVDAGDHLRDDDGRIPAVSRCTQWCWQVVCPCCSDPVDFDGEYGPGEHLSLGEAEEWEADLDNHGLCAVCSNAVLYGSVAAGDGSILPGLPRPSRPVELHPDQMALIGHPEEVCEL